MQGLHPLARSFALLCIGSALGLALIEWRDPFGWKVADARPTQAVSNVSTRVPWVSIMSGRRPLAANRLPALPSDTHIVLQLSERKIDVYRQGEVIKQYLVAVGQAEWETPEGTFTVIQAQEYPTWQHPITGEIIPAGKNNPLGSRWIGFLSSSDGEIGFHGTNEERLIGEAVSHGCVRMLNEDIEDLYTYVEVGTTVIVKR
ncbi:L,D-transpeptidase [Leptothoe sp. PORK10 BA2]|uniref:L,D-transpeptidase n=1 Tax=Leptothoe sp. PORK10 BA2 TaxID=3110254 RepID=UPI002B1EA5F2|nr:L,D-transpeptidase [Leptothoe sp. PORK10 BA2]MEA5463444.1 L,D-transpeptidase [Leptothoe sp. PORK10 BA2]